MCKRHRNCYFLQIEINALLSQVARKLKLSNFFLNPSPGSLPNWLKQMYCLVTSFEFLQYHNFKKSVLYYFISCRHLRLGPLHEHFAMAAQFKTVTNTEHNPVKSWNLWTKAVYQDCPLVSGALGFAPAKVSKHDSNHVVGCVLLFEAGEWSQKWF